MHGTYIEVEITTDPLLFDDLVGMLSVKGYEGFWEEGIRLRAYVRSESWNGSRRKELEEVVSSITEQHALPTPAITTRLIEDQNWNALWEAGIQPIRVSDRIIVAPTWHPYSPALGELVLTIDPKMSFGTGHHETTRLMVQLLEKHLLPGNTMLDVGTGTGILAIAGVKLGATSAVGVDNDEWSFGNAQENVKLNGVQESISIVLGEIQDLPAKEFDIVAANIQRGIIEQILPHMRQRLAAGGRILISGLLDADLAPMRTALAAQRLRPIDELHEKEWVALAAVHAPL
jgi:ribosomal protein L11 methyltransferase